MHGVQKLLHMHADAESGLVSHREVRGAIESETLLGPRLLDDVIVLGLIQYQQSGICHPVSRLSLLSGGTALICSASFMRSSLRLEAESKI